MINSDFTDLSLTLLLGDKLFECHTHRSLSVGLDQKEIARHVSFEILMSQVICKC